MESLEPCAPALPPFDFAQCVLLRRDKKDALRLVLSEAAAAQGDSAGAMHQIRYVAARHPRSPVVWNAYARAVACSGSMRPALRHLTGMRQKFPDSLPLMVLLGNSYTIAVGITKSLPLLLVQHATCCSRLAAAID